ncbi:hypothetical protein BDD12DRAFT_916812 [Trichophaea hybrida]|nr:hypothetical protein BDD12DRAFT_916812 [Trichophaea hybrida]
MSVKYAPFESAIDLPFYYSLAAHKIDYDKLDDSPRKVLGRYVPRDGHRMQIQGDALVADRYGFSDIPIIAKDSCRAEGMIKNFNTLEEFKKADRSGMLKRTATTIWDAILDGSIYSCPSLLSSLLILSYADLKKYKFHHLFAFPAFVSTPTWSMAGPITRLDAQQTAQLVESVNTWQYRVDSRQRGFFLVKQVEGQYEIGSLGDFERGFFGEDYEDNPGWPLRNLLVLVRKRWGWKSVRVLCYRDTHVGRLELGDEMPKVVGWEKNDENQVRPRIANLSAQMDPKIQADINVDLNLKLMKWRVAPDLDLDKIKNTKCLLLGAGTLGSYVARILLGWGIKTITFVDSGTVSFSNPVRQPLFTFQDCVGGKTNKASQAAEALTAIYPGVNATGYDMTELFENHDAIFLLMDTRESRWLPTVMGKSMGKIVMNSALGFDTYVVMRHGVKPEKFEKAVEKIKGEELGCYYCNDVAMYSYSAPGVHLLASAYLAELLVSVVQHPLGSPAAPAPENTTNTDRGSHPLGHVPHLLRGSFTTSRT